ncbi:MAG: ATP-binding cassette domain-containing protein [Pseudomonadota bacterium]
MDEAALSVKNLSAGHGAGDVVRSVSFTLPRGGRLALLGRNGAGKTTLCEAIMGLNPKSAGDITLHGAPLTRRSAHQRARAGLGLVRQGRHVFAALTVLENLRAVGGQVAEAMALFPQLAPLAAQPAGSLSGGEQQMLALARTLLLRPTVLLLDEPLEGLSPTVRADVMAALQDRVADGLSVVLVEQDVSAALAFADSALVLVDGAVAYSGVASELSASPGRVSALIGVGG